MPHYLASTLYVATETNVSLISLNMSCAERNKAEFIVYGRRRKRENAYHSALQCGMQTKITPGRFFKHLIKPQTTYTKFAIPWDLTVFLSQLQVWLRLVLCFIAASYRVRRQLHAILCPRRLHFSSTVSPISCPAASIAYARIDAPGFPCTSAIL